MITYRYDLDMVPGGVPVIVNVSQYDNAFSIEFHLYSRTGSLDLSSVDSAAIRGKKLDGHAYSADAAYDNGVVTVTGHVQMTAISGKQTFEITLYDSVENELNSANFILNVEDAPMDQDDITSDSVIRELFNVTSRADKIIQAASDAEAWAVGQRDGVDVDTDDEAYHNNAKYYRDASISSASAAATSASQAASSASSASSSASQASTSATQAALSASDAVTSALEAAASAEKIEELTVAATTLAEGSSATVTKTTESGHYKLTFGIPKGAKGDKGNKGDTGETGETGTSITSIRKTGTSGLVDTYTITFSDSTTTTFTVTNGQNGSGSVADVLQNGVSVLDGDTARVTVPTKTSDLTNDSGFLTQHQDISGKVDKVTGKGLSTNDYTTAEKDKLAGIAAGAEVNVQSDWNQTTTTADDFIKNKPAIPTKVSDLTNDSGYIGGDVVADEYSTSSTYAVGDYCLYDGDLYRCTTAITTAEAWNSAHWTMVTIGEEITDLKGDIAVKVAAKDRTGTLTTSGWSNKSQTIAVVGLDPEDTAIVSIDSSDASGYEAARDSDIRLTGRANGTLTFSCEDVPTSNIGVVITILE